MPLLKNVKNCNADIMTIQNDENLECNYIKKNDDV